MTEEERTDNTGLAKVALQTHLWLIKNWFFASTFVVNIAGHTGQPANPSLQKSQFSHPQVVIANFKLIFT